MENQQEATTPGPDFVQEVRDEHRSHVKCLSMQPRFKIFLLQQPEINTIHSFTETMRC